jgi:hypothetical protein
LIYVMTSDHKTIKIGLTTGPAERRRRSLQTGHDVPLTVIHLLDGGRAEERALHQQFAEFRVHPGGEWFFAAPRVRAWLSTLAPHDPPEKRETAIAYLTRLGTDWALAAVAEWSRMVAWGERYGSCSHTLWDMLAGNKGQVEPLFGRVAVTRRAVWQGDVFRDVFYFPLLAEACERQGASAAPGSRRTRKRPRSLRLPQPGRWGHKLRSAQRRP